MVATVTCVQAGLLWSIARPFHPNNTSTLLSNDRNYMADPVKKCPTDITMFALKLRGDC
jgi:hypothetical protein